MKFDFQYEHFMYQLYMDLRAVRPEQAALSDSESVIANSRYTIVCTTGMVADVVRNIVGEHAAVRTLIPTGVDPHCIKQHARMCCPSRMRR